ncbi:hypothetical protein V8E54_000641 [Elaphomyces granulatus]
MGSKFPGLIPPFRFEKPPVTPVQSPNNARPSSQPSTPTTHPLATKNPIAAAICARVVHPPPTTPVVHSSIENETSKPPTTVEPPKPKSLKGVSLDKYEILGLFLVCLQQRQRYLEDKNRKPFWVRISVLLERIINRQYSWQSCRRMVTLQTTRRRIDVEENELCNKADQRTDLETAIDEWISVQDQAESSTVLSNTEEGFLLDLDANVIFDKFNRTGLSESRGLKRTRVSTSPSPLDDSLVEDDSTTGRQNKLHITEHVLLFNNILKLYRTLTWNVNKNGEQIEQLTREVRNMKEDLQSLHRIVEKLDLLLSKNGD